VNVQVTDIRKVVFPKKGKASPPGCRTLGVEVELLNLTGEGFPNTTGNVGTSSGKSGGGERLRKWGRGEKIEMNGHTYDPKKRRLSREVKQKVEEDSGGISQRRNC